MQYLVLGANSYIGSYLYRRLKEEGYDVYGTYHTRMRADEGIEFNILTDNISNSIEKDRGSKKIAIDCIAQCNIDMCYKEYKMAYMINVIKTKEMLRTLFENGYKIMYFSSDNVFDGKLGKYTELDKVNPINEYGKMKVEVEDFLLNKITNMCIFRLPKVLDLRNVRQNMLYELSLLQKGETYRCIKGNIMSFLYIEDLYRVIIRSEQTGLEGLFHVCGDEMLSRMEFIEKFFSISDKKDRRVIECNIEEILFEDERRPLNVSMKNDKIKNILKYNFMNINAIIKKYSTFGY